MRTQLLSCVLLALSVAAIAQTAPAPAQATQAQSIQSSQTFCSNGPVVADYGRQIEKSGNSTEARIAKEVRHELLMLPYYSLFDDLEFCVQDRVVTLTGSVTSSHSQTKQDAEQA